MGGHTAGAVASQNASFAIQQYLQDPNNGNSNTPRLLKNAIEFANYQLRQMVNEQQELKGMGTTCVIALLNDGFLHTAHAGDSRIYLVRKEHIKQITKDHSSVQHLMDTGVLTEKEAELSDKKHEISKAIGVFDKVEPTITSNPIGLHKNDKLLLCSDGLTGHMSKEKILEIILSNDDVQNVALKLITYANEAGGVDNITVQLIHYTGKSTYGIRKLSVKKIAAAFLLVAIVVFFSFWFYRNGVNINKAGIKVKENPATVIDKTRDTAPKKTP